MDLDRAQTEWTLGRFASEELPELAAQMMIQGFDSPAILELASFHRPPDVPAELVRRAFRDCGRAPLSREDAELRHVESLLRANAPAADILSAVWHLAELMWEGPLSELTRLAHDWSEAVDDPRRRETLEDHVPAAARRYLEKRR
jgi:hypothetical protein